MLSLVDIHSHALYGVDDGASDREQMCAMLKMAYEDGIRAMCLTPHYAPPMFDETADKAAAVFGEAEAYCREKLPGLKLALGNELHYHADCAAALRDGRCCTLAGTRYVLVDFFMGVSLSDLTRGVSAIANHGYLPILAHAERYDCAHGHLREFERMSEEGILIQVNAQSLCFSVFDETRRMAYKLFSRGLVDIVASDGHNTDRRPPMMSRGYELIRRKYGEPCAKRVFCDNPARVLAGERIG